ncbi:preprotein translocase subunit YajC [Pelobium manganitolerans]|uniref:Sec translocon accessory complex subunit YajC n=1 Tax=Pelobium manganitolerans TaxID=1842495 RepID=A0A419S4M3_9SPHI|nr:preprotein translocase subunit YajC [Pelobium manganitolerans]RKD15056.1 preprotein translocase subunit YajC [Pelobium manganitolerans]
MLLNFVLLQVSSEVMNFLPMILIVVVFYFFMIRPQMKKAKDHKKFIAELKKGDKVITTAGIHGKIVEMNETTFLLEMESGAKIRFDKAAVSLDSSKELNK